MGVQPVRSTAVHSVWRWMVVYGVRFYRHYTEAECWKVVVTCEVIHYGADRLVGLSGGGFVRGPTTRPSLPPPVFPAWAGYTTYLGT
jgi:hypothetical protein